MSEADAYRILIIDDNPAIHEDFRKIFAESAAPARALRDLESSIFGDTSRFSRVQAFELESALQGQEGLDKVNVALALNRPFALAFVDIRMPPGWDGLETVEQLWKAEPHLQIVICTAYSDYSWGDMRRRLGHSDSLMVLKKPFDNIEVLQMAHALTRKYELARQNRTEMETLDELVVQRTRELEVVLEQLRAEREQRGKVESALLQARQGDSVEWATSGVPQGFDLVLTAIRRYGDCLPEGGKINLTAARVSVDASAPGAHPEARSGVFLCLTVVETTCRGERPIVLDSFTSQAGAHRTSGSDPLEPGVARAIIQQHNGWLEVINDSSDDPTFRIYLPVLQPAEAGCDRTGESPIESKPATVLPPGAAIVNDVSDRGRSASVRKRNRSEPPERKLGA